MAQSTIAKRIRLTDRVLEKAKGNKAIRYQQKKAYLETLPVGTRFYKGEKQMGEGGYK